MEGEPFAEGCVCEPRETPWGLGAGRFEEGVGDGVVPPASGGGVCGGPSRHLITVNMGVKEDVDLGFRGDFGVIVVEAGEEEGGLAEVELPWNGGGRLIVETSVPTGTTFDAIKGGLEAVGELVAVDQISVEGRSVEAGARGVE